jgi:hypothetical protein
MTRPCLNPLRLLLIGAAVACGCSSDGKTPDCPPLPHYDVRVPKSQETLAALKAAAAKGCITLPLGEAGAGTQ